MTTKEKFNKLKTLSKELRNNKDEKVLKEIEKITKDLKQSALQTFKEESDFKTFLDNIGRFNNYSYNNQLLIYLQRPDYKFVGSFKTFKDLGYSVKASPDSINIIRPVHIVRVYDNEKKQTLFYSQLTDKQKEIYKDKDDNRIVFHSKKLVNFAVGTIFDIRDTTMPFEEIEKKLYPHLNNENISNYIDIVEQVIKDNNFTLEYKSTLRDMEGYCTFDERKIVVSDQTSGIGRLKVLVHELAHSLAHTNLENNYEDYKKDRRRYEVEAESISYSICKYFNIDSEDRLAYLYNYSKNKDFQEIDNSLQMIVETSANIVKMINEKTINVEIVYNIDI